MKIYIGPYKNWFGPFQFVEKLFFFLSEEKRDKIVDYIPKKPFEFIDKLKRDRKIKVVIHDYDVWSVDSTLSYIIVPLLKKMKDNLHGAPYVDDNDVPDELKSTAAPKLTQDQIDTGHVDELHFKRWDWVIEEMIWAFEQHGIDWENQYYSGEHDIIWEKVGDGEFFEMKTGPKDTFKIDKEGMSKHRDRMNNGLRLFGKYYGSLWT